MPLYEYECETCAHRFELIQKFSDPPALTCPVCGGAVKKLLSSPAIQFKGTGWYITDYARKGGGDAGKTESKSGSKDTESKSATKDTASGESTPSSDTKPAESKTTTTGD
jgi:putative FmdB family regulatory protein